MTKNAWLMASVVALALAACAGPAPAVTPAPTATAFAQPTAQATLPAAAATPTAGGASLTLPELKLRLLGQYPDFFYCDPDLYPVARSNEADLAVERFPTVQADRETFAAIVRYLKLDGVTTFSAEQKLTVYQLSKRMNAVVLQADGSGYTFTTRLRGAGGGAQGTAVTGTISVQGVVAETTRQPTIVSCPICLARGTLIDTPDGPTAVEDMRPGMRVWTIDANGARTAAVVVRAEHVDAPLSHMVLRVTLADGRMLTASPGHPTADGRALADLRVGDLLDGTRIAAVESMVYDGGATYDILPSGPTGAYWANGILMGSTLR